MPGGSASGVKAGKAYVEITTKDNALKSGLKRVQGFLNSFAATAGATGAAMFGAGSAVMGGLLGLAQVAAGMGDELSKASDRTGVAVEQLSQLKYAAEQSDATLDDVVSGIIKMQRAITG